MPSKVRLAIEMEYRHAARQVKSGPDESGLSFCGLPLCAAALSPRKHGLSSQP